MNVLGFITVASVSVASAAIAFAAPPADSADTAGTPAAKAMYDNVGSGKSAQEKGSDVYDANLDAKIRYQREHGNEAKELELEKQEMRKAWNQDREKKKDE